jgi:redox-sensitive bicupin YhaK (pirin superfamily)
MGNVEVLPAGEFQLMSAGTGITHSEYNPPSTDSLEFLQIWIEPDKVGIEPAYQQKKFPRQTGLQLIASPDARDRSLLLHQDALLHQLIVDTRQRVSYQTDPGRRIYVHVVSGQLGINGEFLREGDGAIVDGVES